MRYLGRITDWNDAQGFGFVTPNGGGDRAFVHVKAFERRGRRPAIGDLVSYAVERDARGRVNAAQLRFAGALPSKQSARSARPHMWRSNAIPRKTLALLAFVVLGLAVWRHVLPIVVCFVYVAVSTLTYMAYAWDKAAAERGAWRTTENTLHVLSLFGGWPGALLAQSRLRHKSSKAEFQAVFWITVLVNCGGLIWFFRSVAWQD
jgi:uncharacterized membrane protein YsdA (DUF1294 family)/cold shock CspA family protein